MIYLSVACSMVVDPHGPPWSSIQRTSPSPLLLAFSRRHVGPNEGAVSVGPFGATEWGLGAVPGPWHLRRFLWRRLRRAGVLGRRPDGLLALSLLHVGVLPLLPNPQ